MIATSRAIARGRRGAVEAGQAKACAPGGPITAMQGKLKHNAAWFSYSTFAVFLTACNQRTNSTGPSVERGFQTSISRAILAADTMKWRCGAQTLRRLAGQALRERLLDSATWRLCKNRARKPSGIELKHAPPGRNQSEPRALASEILTSAGEAPQAIHASRGGEAGQ